MSARLKAMLTATVGVLILMNTPRDCAVAPFLWGYATCIASLMFAGGIVYLVVKD